MEDERRRLEERREEIELAKDPAQRRLERFWWSITGLATLSSRGDDVTWGTHTPVPTDIKDKEDELEEEKSD